MLSSPRQLPPSPIHPSPNKSISTPTSHILSSSSSPSLPSSAISPSGPSRMLHASESSIPGKAPYTPPRVAPPRPIPNTVPRSQTRSSSWDNSSSVWQSPGGMIPPTPSMFVDLSLAPKLDLPSVSESISAMKER